MKRQCGAALLAAMLTVTLVATFASAALWQQFRSIEVESSERARVQSGWILTGSLDWARLILREDARAGGADYLAEPWAVPLNEARLSSFLAADAGASDTDLKAFLSGQISDVQARLNVANLVEGSRLSEAGMASFSRLFELLGLAPEPLRLMANRYLLALQTPSGENRSSMLLRPERVEQLAWLGMPAETLARLEPFITLLPIRTAINLNTASAEVIYASTPGLSLSEAQRLVAARASSHFRNLAEADLVLSAQDQRFQNSGFSVASNFFEVLGRLRVEKTVVQERSLVQREGLLVRILWRDRISAPDFSADTGAQR
jgi:general secretion pathway protein K